LQTLQQENELHLVLTSVLRAIFHVTLCSCRREVFCQELSCVWVFILNFKDLTHAFFFLWVQRKLYAVSSWITRTQTVLKQCIIFID